MSQPGGLQPLPPGLGEALIAVSSDGILQLDHHDRVTRANPAAARILGHDLVGASVSRLLPPACLASDGPASIQLGATSYDVRRAQVDAQSSLMILQVDRSAASDSRGSGQEQKLYDLLMTISSALDMPTILERVAQLTMELIGADASSIPLYDAERDVIVPGWLINLPAVSFTSPIPRGVGMIWDVIDSGEPALINNYAGLDRVMPAMVAAGVSAVLSAPIIGTGRAIFGVLAAYRLGPDKGFTMSDLDQVALIGRQTGIAIQNARLYADIVREVDRRHTLYVASVEIGAALDPEALYTAIHHAARGLMTCDSIAIGHYERDRDEIDYVYIVDQQRRWPARRISVERGLLGYVIRNHLSLRLNNTDPEIEAIVGAERMHSDADVTRSILATVMHTRKQIVGAITVQAFAADAYSSKDLDALEMLASTAAIATQNARLFARIQQMATIDSLTQIPNRRHFFDVATREIERTDRYKHPLSLIMFDVDSFKSVNDTYGHPAGDQVLREIATRCRDGLRDIDMIARFGGEEFVALLPETTYEGAILVAQRLLARISEPPILSDAGPIAVTVSIGVDCCDEVAAGSLSDLIDRADQALYAAKRGGRNRVIGFRSLVLG